MRSASATITATDDPIARPSKSAFLYLMLECRRPLAGGARWALDGVDEVRLGRGDERRATRDSGNAGLSIEIPDTRMSSRHARLAHLAGGWAFEDLGSKNGARVNGVATARAALADGDVIEIGETLLLFREEACTEPTDASGTDALAPGLVSIAPAFEAAIGRLAAIARADVCVLVSGETGTGKELIARAAHSLSGRSGRFVAVNCGALPSALVEATLFGHRHGAFSGSVESRPGLVRSADRGTLFLDEIGDLPLASQAALLRVLQEKEVTPVGETAPTHVDVRFVAATHRDLRALSERGSFRQDLLARLEGHVVELAPLRERRCDFGVLVAAILARAEPARAKSLTFHPTAARALVSHDWPENVRELEQALRSAAALTEDGVIMLAHLPSRVREPAPSGAGPRSKPTPESLSSEDAALREQLLALLTEHRGSVNGVARAMGKDRTQIRRWITRFQIDADRFRLP